MKVFYKKVCADDFKDIANGSFVRFIDKKTGKLIIAEVSNYLFSESAAKLIVSISGEKESIYSNKNTFVFLQTNDKKDMKVEDVDAELRQEQIEYLSEEAEKAKKNFEIIKDLFHKLKETKSKN